MKIKELTNYIEVLAPLAYQESYDNAGLIVGDANTDITGVLICLDSTEAVIDEAIAKGCNLVVAHHPIVFKGLKKLNGKNYVERTIIKAIKNDIAIYATHTNLDSVVGGVNFKISQVLDLQRVRVLSPKINSLMKLIVFVPIDSTEAVLAALHESGAGVIGNYSHVSFRSEGTGGFRPNDTANPTIGAANVDEKVRENRVEVIFPVYLKSQILGAMHRSHPYEEVAYDVILLENQNKEVGSGAIGELAEAMSEADFLQYLKQRMNVSVIRHTQLLGKPIKKVAVCGGAGGFLLNDAIAQNADIFITSDYKYHEFFDADGRTIIADIGHYESEQFTKELLKDYICKKMLNFAVRLSETHTNPVKYF